jgi:hypothetical protein
MDKEIKSITYPEYTIGSKIGKLTILNFRRECFYGKAKVLVDCKCECGKQRTAIFTQIAYHFKKNRPVSCGCIPKAFKHGGCKTPEYVAYMNMKKRCTVKTNMRYKDYGGRGITICQSWLSGFSNFYKDMGKKPSKFHSLDRIDNNGNYEPTNCKWSTSSEQALNRSTSKKYTQLINHD